MPRNKTYFPYAVVVGLGVILVVLAVLQYRWSNQVSQAESDRMKASLWNATDQFRQDFSRELQSLSAGLQPDAEVLADEDWAAYASQSADWLKSSTYPDLVSTVYVWRPDKALLSLDRKNKKFENAEPPASLSPVFERIRQQTDPSRQGRGLRTLSWTLDGAVPALFRSLTVFSDPEDRRAAQPKLVGFVIVALSRSFMETHFLPDLATKHFGGPAGFLYQVGVYTAGDATKPVYQSGAPFSKQAIAAADIKMDLVEVRQGRGGPARGTLTAPAGPPPQQQEAMREPPPPNEPPREARNGPPPNWNRGGFGGKRGRRAATDAPPAQGGQPNAAVRNGFAYQERVRQARRFGVAPPPQPIVADSRSSWLLVVRHRAGSVDAAVAALRTKNLAVSFAILLLLGVSMALIVIASQRAQRLARLQVEFVAGVSHELRTPLAVISSAADNLTDGIVEGKPQVKLYGTLIRNEARRLEGMMEQILEFASGQKRRTYDPKILAVPDLIDRAISFCSNAIQESGFTVEKSVDTDLAPVSAEEHGMLQCLQNLIANAVKYGGEKRWIGIEAHMDNGSVVISVADRGMGIGPEDLPHIFDAFYRGRAATDAQIHGTGLGLSLAKSFAQAAGGNITATSVLGEGSCFTLRLPAARPALAATQPLLAGRTA